MEHRPAAVMKRGVVYQCLARVWQLGELIGITEDEPFSSRCQQLESVVVGGCQEGEGYTWPVIV